MCREDNYFFDVEVAERLFCCAVVFCTCGDDGGEILCGWFADDVELELCCGCLNGILW